MSQSFVIIVLCEIECGDVFYCLSIASLLAIGIARVFLKTIGGVRSPTMYITMKGDQQWFDPTPFGHICLN